MYELDRYWHDTCRTAWLSRSEHNRAYLEEASSELVNAETFRPAMSSFLERNNCTAPQRNRYHLFQTLTQACMNNTKGNHRVLTTSA